MQVFTFSHQIMNHLTANTLGIRRIYFIIFGAQYKYFKLTHTELVVPFNTTASRHSQLQADVN